MLIERQLAPALILVGGTLLLPGVLGAMREAGSHVSAGAVLAGNLLAGAGLGLEALLVTEDSRGRAFKALGLSFFGLCAALFCGGTALAALRSHGVQAAAMGAAALLPPAGFAAGAVRGLKG